MRRVLVGIGSLALAASLLSGCGGDDKDEKGGAPVVTAAFSARGGAGTGGAGGSGAQFAVTSSSGGEITIVRSGGVDTAIALPTDLPYLGANWQDVTVDTTLEVGASGFHLVAGSAGVLNDTGTVTGIRVRPGVTLTIRPNFPAAAARTQAELTLDEGLLVEGTIRLARRDASVEGDGLGADTAGLVLTAGGLHVGASGRIDLSGAENLAGPGGNGGSLSATQGAVLNLGVVTTHGGSGTVGGGVGGNIRLAATAGYAASTGSFISDGGDASAGPGGPAGSQELSSGGYGYVVGKGRFSAIGGNGIVGGGGGNAVLLSSAHGDVVAGGTFETYGGDALTDGAGGFGALVRFVAWGDLRAAGTIDTHGGKGAGLGGGGQGGPVMVETHQDQPQGGGIPETGSGALYFGASVKTDGGAGTDGGPAGSFLANCAASGLGSVVPPLQLVGYPTIDLSGGDGSTNGGSASPASSITWSAPLLGRGGISNSADFVMRGGEGRSTFGGAGAGLRMAMPSLPLLGAEGLGLTNRGRLDGTGGRGASNGGAGGVFDLAGTAFLSNSGAILSNGGAAGTGSGGPGTLIRMISSGSLDSSGLLSANGGSSASGSGGFGGVIQVMAAGTVTVSTVTANGGASTSGSGGPGSAITIWSNDGATTHGLVEARAGVGAVGSPPDGWVMIDGMQIAGQ